MSVKLPVAIRVASTLGLPSPALRARPNYPFCLLTLASTRHISKKQSALKPINIPKSQPKDKEEERPTTPVPALSTSKDVVTKIPPPTPAKIEPTSRSKVPDVPLDPTKEYPGRDLSSTRPAKLETPEPLDKKDFGGTIPIQDRVKYLYHLGRSYVSFYKTGLKNIWSNYKEYRQLKQKLGRFPLKDVVKHSGENGRPIITRREYQLYLRTRHDITKLIPFGLILLICGEFTPLVVLALGSKVVPSNCRIPKQLNHDRVKHFQRWLNPALSNSGGDANKEFSSEAQRGLFWNDNKFIRERQEDLKREIMTLTEMVAGEPAQKIESNPSVIPTETKVAYLWGIIPSPNIPSFLQKPLWKYWIHPRVKRRAEEVLCDAILIEREVGLGRLEPAELLEFAQKSNSGVFPLYFHLYHTPGEVLNIETQKMRNALLGLLNRDLKAMLDAYAQLKNKPDSEYLAGLVRASFPKMPEGMPA